MIERIASQVQHVHEVHIAMGHVHARHIHAAGRVKGVEGVEGNEIEAIVLGSGPCSRGVVAEKVEEGEVGTLVV